MCMLYANIDIVAAIIAHTMFLKLKKQSREAIKNFLVRALVVLFRIIVLKSTL